MSSMASQITGVSKVYSTVCSGVDQRIYQNAVSLAFARGIHRWPEFPAQRASNAKKVSIWWRHQGGRWITTRQSSMQTEMSTSEAMCTLSESELTDSFDNNDGEEDNSNEDGEDEIVVWQQNHIHTLLVHGKESPPTWWRHQMETFSLLLALCEGNHPTPLATKASGVELWCFLWSAPEQTIEQTIETSVIWESCSLWRHCNEITYTNTFIWCSPHQSDGLWFLFLNSHSTCGFSSQWTEIYVTTDRK